MSAPLYSLCCSFVLILIPVVLIKYSCCGWLVCLFVDFKVEIIILVIPCTLILNLDPSFIFIFLYLVVNRLYCSMPSCYLLYFLIIVLIYGLLFCLLENLVFSTMTKCMWIMLLKVKREKERAVLLWCLLGTMLLISHLQWQLFLVSLNLWLINKVIWTLRGMGKSVNGWNYLNKD